MEVQLSGLVESPRTLIAYVLLGFVVRFHVVVQVCHLERERADNLVIRNKKSKVDSLEQTSVRSLLRCKHKAVRRCAIAYGYSSL